MEKDRCDWFGLVGAPAISAVAPSPTSCAARHHPTPRRAVLRRRPLAVRYAGAMSAQKLHSSEGRGDSADVQVAAGCGCGWGCRGCRERKNKRTVEQQWAASGPEKLDEQTSSVEYCDNGAVPSSSVAFRHDRPGPGAARNHPLTSSLTPSTATSASRLATSDAAKSEPREGERRLAAPSRGGGGGQEWGKYRCQVQNKRLSSISLSSGSPRSSPHPEPTEASPSCRSACRRCCPQSGICAAAAATSGNLSGAGRKRETSRASKCDTVT